MWSDEKEKRICDILMLSTLGWNPEIWRHVQKKRRLKAAVFLFLFLVDLADAVFDVILSLKTMIVVESEEGSSIGLGILLFVATVLGRILSGLYGRYVAMNPPSIEEADAFSLFCTMEIGVFFLEDGAAILVLANGNGEMDVLEKISMYLTIVCGLCYIGYIVYIMGKGLLNEDGKMDCCGQVARATVVLIPLSSGVFLTYILITQVILTKSNEEEGEDLPFSGGIEVAAFVVYGLTALIVGGYAFAGFSGILD